MNMPNFLVIGAQKAGTTSLNNYLAQHPMVYMSPIKEPDFFALEGVIKGADASRGITTDLASYQRLFETDGSFRAVGEVSPIYLYSPVAAARIQHYLPQAKLVAILRDPVGRAYSAFLHNLRLGWEKNTDFLRALQAPELGSWLMYNAVERHEEGLHQKTPMPRHYIRRGFYFQQLKRYFDRFDHAQIKVCLYDDLRGDVNGLMADLFSFLEVDPAFIPDVSVRHNPARVPRNALWGRLFGMRSPIRRFAEPLHPLVSDGMKRALKRLYMREPEQKRLPPEVRAELVPVFREDILRLQDLIGRDLSRWLV